MQITTQLNRAVLDICVLALITDREVYGYDLIQQLKVYGFTVSVGTLYPLLSQLRKNGYVSSVVKDSAVGPSRRYYALTVVGNKYLEEGASEFSVFSKSVGKLLNKFNSKK